MQQNSPKFFQFFLVFGITFLMVSWLMPTQEHQSSLQGKYAISVADSSITVPNSPVLTIENNTSDPKKFEVCRDLMFRRNGDLVEDLPKDFCRDEVIIGPNSKINVDTYHLNKLFYIPASFDVRLFSSGSEVSNLTIIAEKQGFFRSLVTTAFYAPILNLFVGIITFLPDHSLGLAIILLTVLVRLILLVPQHKSMVAARRMQELQPKIAALKEEYKDNQQQLGLKMMELWKRENVNPFGACLPILIQLPFLSAIYFLLISVHDTANGYYLYQFFHDFSFPSIDKMFLGIDLLSVGGTLGIIAAVILGLAQFIQIRLSLKTTHDQTKPKKSLMQALEESAASGSAMPNQEVMSRFFLYFMPVIISVSALFFPLGLTLYWFIGNLFMIAQQIVANKVATHKKKAKKISD
ncbi:MAG: YidC/Oxa1 family membrane protein insertase [Candidatus Gracilibacteria bacterium]